MCVITCGAVRALVTLHTQSTGLYILPQTKPRRAEPTTRLVLPISVADIEAFTNRLRSPDGGSVPQIDALHAHLLDLQNMHVMPHLRAIEAQNGKASARLTEIKGTPATIVIAGAAAHLQNILPAAHTPAMGTCTTTSTNPDKIAYQKRSDARKRAKLTKKLQALNNACTKSHKHERQEGGPIDADTLFQDDDPHQQAAAETLRDTRDRAEHEGTDQESDPGRLARCVALWALLVELP
jgi:hypothetical protein